VFNIEPEQIHCEGGRASRELGTPKSASERQEQGRKGREGDWRVKRGEGALACVHSSITTKGKVRQESCSDPAPTRVAHTTCV
jgi:hypothetical protein